MDGVLLKGQNRRIWDGDGVATVSNTDTSAVSCARRKEEVVADKAGPRVRVEEGGWLG